MISRGKPQVKRKTLLKVVYLKKLKGLIESSQYWGFCNFACSDNKIKKFFLAELNSFYYSRGFCFVKIRASYLTKLLLVSNVDVTSLKFLSPLFKNAFVLLLTNDFYNIVNFPFKEYNETKLVIYAWRINTQLFCSNIFLNKLFLNFVIKSKQTLLYNLRKNYMLLRLLNIYYKKN